MYFLISVPKESRDRGSSCGDCHSNTDSGRAETRPWSQLLLSCGEEGKTPSPTLTPVCLGHTAGAFCNGLQKTNVLSFLTGRHWCTWCCRSEGWKGHLPLQYCVWQRGVCVSDFCFYSGYVYIFRVTLVLKVLSDQQASKGKKEKLYEILKCPHSHIFIF